MRYLLFLTWAAASCLMYWTMSHGPGVTPDSIIYLEAARSVLSGRGFVVAGAPMTHFPPVYPLLIAFVGMFNHNLLAAAHLLHALFFGANVVLVGSAVYLATGRRVRAAAAAMLLLVISGPVLDLHAMAWSEAPFLAFTLAGLLVLSATIGFPHRRILALAALCLGLAAATRYVGIILIPMLLLVIWMMGQRSAIDRLKDTLVALPLAAGPLVLWLVRNASVSHGLTDRKLVLHPVGAPNLAQLAETLSDLALPLHTGIVLKILILAVLALLLLAAWIIKPHRDHENWYAALGRALPVLCVLFSAMYLSFLLLSISLADASTPLDDRILFPVFAVMIVAGVVVVEQAATEARWIEWVLLVGLLLSIGLRLREAQLTVARIHRDGSGYNSEGWLTSPAIAHLDPLPGATLVYSNASEAVGYLTSRPVMPFPDSLLPETLQPNRRYRIELEALCWRVGRGRAVAIYLTTEGIGDPDEQARLEKSCDFPHAAAYPDGTIYSAAPLDSTGHGRGPDGGHSGPGLISASAGRVGREGSASYIPPPKAR